MDNKEFFSFCEKYGINPNHPATSFSEKEIVSNLRFALPQLQQNQRSNPWHIVEVMQMYYDALANGATIEQVEASCLDQYGITFGALYAAFWAMIGLMTFIPV